MESTKICSVCKEEKPLSYYHKSKITSNGLRPNCKDCRREYTRSIRSTPEGKKKAVLNNKKWRENNREKTLARRKELRVLSKLKNPKPPYSPVFFKVCVITNKLFTSQTNGAKYSREGRRIKARENQRTEEYKIIKRKRRRVSDNLLRKENPMFRLRENISRSINQSLKKGKGGNWEILLGFTLAELRQHIEDLFVDGMSWDNYGKKGWHIDHIKPIALFSLDSTEDKDFKECWSLKNLQPLWWYDNLKKGAKYEPSIAA